MNALGTLGQVRNLPCVSNFSYDADDFDDETLTADEAHEQATDEFMTTPASLATAISDLCGCDIAIPVDQADELSVLDGAPSLLLAYAISGRDDKLRLMALDLLADKVREHAADAIKDIADAILKESQQ